MNKYKRKSHTLLSSYKSNSNAIHVRKHHLETLRQQRREWTNIRVVADRLGGLYEESALNAADTYDVGCTLCVLADVLQG